MSKYCMHGSIILPTNYNLSTHHHVFYEKSDEHRKIIEFSMDNNIIWIHTSKPTSGGHLCWYLGSRARWMARGSPDMPSSWLQDQNVRQLSASTKALNSIPSSSPLDLNNVVHKNLKLNVSTSQKKGENKNGIQEFSVIICFTSIA